MRTTFEVLESPTAADISLSGRRVVNFAGSAYLGIANDPSLIAAGEDALRRYGARAHLPRHYGVITQPQIEVEEESTRFFATSSALYLASGYLLGLTVLTGLRDRYDVVVLDENAHYSLRDAAAASRAPVRIFAHLDCDALAAKLEECSHRGERVVVAVDGVCPTFGRLPRLDIYADLAAKYNALLFVDESHSYGTLGANGRGALEERGVRPDVALCGGSLGKAFCASGAVLTGALTDIMPLRTAPCVRGSSWGMVAAAAMATASLQLVRARPQLRASLQSNVRALKSGLRGLGLHIDDNVAPVAAFVVGSASNMRQLQQRLLDENIFVLHSSYPSAGPEGAIRCSIFADHTLEQIDRLLRALRRAL
jgi:8-amino-7-oxononanoate synthase